MQFSLSQLQFFFGDFNFLSPLQFKAYPPSQTSSKPKKKKETNQVMKSIPGDLSNFTLQNYCHDNKLKIKHAPSHCLSIPLKLFKGHEHDMS
uniref:Uncharacterized protein n=1 Tax=Solanum lycopersicum TaxID=4081 RepID=A0A3Q7I3Z9_SOLLC